MSEGSYTFTFRSNRPIDENLGALFEFVAEFGSDARRTSLGAESYGVEYGRDDAPVVSRPMIETERLTKRYGDTIAVDQITFSVRKGEVLGFLGPNGAGKSSTIRMLTCYVAPTSGRATISGLDVFDDRYEIAKRIGYLPEDTPIYRDMTVVEFLSFAGEMRRMNRNLIRRRIKDVGLRCGLGNVAGKLIGELSKGFRQRVGLAQSLLHDPEILILDEPTSGLDPNQIVEIRELIKEIGRDKTILLSTHILPEVQATCSRIVIISGGKLVADGTPSDLRQLERGSRYRVVVESDGVEAPTVRDRLASLAGVISCRTDRGDAGSYAFIVDSVADRPDIFRAAVDNRWTLLELARESPTLEDVFRRVTTTEDDIGEPSRLS